MAVRPILRFPHPLLTKPAQPVAAFDAALHALATDLRDTLNASPGVGLAAPQIGVPKCLTLIDLGRTRKKKGAKESSPAFREPVFLVNPILVHAAGSQVPREGCLSVPDFLANVHRYATVTVAARDLTGREFHISGEGFEALALQHEIDHLNGKLFLDRVANVKTDMFRRKSVL